MKTQFMNITKCIAIAWSLASGFAYSDGEYDGPILFKGDVHGTEFKGRMMGISLHDKTFVFECSGSKHLIHLVSNGMIVSDAAPSSNKRFIAVSLQSKNWEKPEMELAVLDMIGGVVKRLPYKLNNMGAHYGWIVEIAAISDDGERVLAKCASVKNTKTNSKVATHDWVVITVKNDNLSIGDPTELAAAWERLLKR